MLDEKPNGQSPRQPNMFVTKDDFHKYVIDNRDRQDRNKKEIIESLEKTITASSKNCQDDVDATIVRVGKLEDGAKKQTVVATSIATMGGILTGIVAYFARGG